MVTYRIKFLQTLIVSLLSFLLLPAWAYSQDRNTSFEQDIELAQKFATESDFNQAIFHYNKAANGLWQNGSLKEAAEQFESALVLSNKLGNHNASFVLNTNLGLIYTEILELDKAIVSIKQSIQNAHSLKRRTDVAIANLNLSNVYFEKKENNEALTALDESHRIAQEDNNQLLLRNIYSLYTKIHEQMGNRQESERFFNLFSAITQKIQQEEVRAKEEAAKQLADSATLRALKAEEQKLATEKELQKKGVELTEKQIILEETERESNERLMLLDKERQMQELLKQNQKNRRKVYHVIILLAIIVSLFLFYSYYQKKKANLLLQQKNEEILAQNKEIQQQAEQLRELNSLKDKLFSIIAHDLRSPLGSLIVLLNLTREGLMSEQDFNQVVQELSKNVSYTSELLENLLNWAQSQMKGLTVKPVNFKLKDVVESKINLYSEQAQNKGVIVKNRVEDEVMVLADYAMVELILRNLIANAIKFCSKGNTVTVSSSIEKNHCLISVSDTGIGMSKEQSERLFKNEIFSTLGTANEKGTGLGLLLAKEFVMLNNGRIWVKSLDGEGSTFFFTLPAAEQN